MFLPSSIVGGKVDALLDPVDESIWYPNAQTGVTVNSEVTTEGINLGLMFTVPVSGNIHSICYYRASDTLATSGTVAIWSITEYDIAGVLTTGETLLGEADFSGHSGTGWKVIPLDEPVQLSTSYAYVASIWFPSDGTQVSVPVTPYTFNIGSKISEPYGFVRGNANSGFFDTVRLFVHRNGLISVGMFERPTGVFNGYNFWVDVIYNARPNPDPPMPPMIIKWPIPEGWPSNENTGHDPETELTVFPDYTMATTADNQIIEDYDLPNGLLINHNNVTVRNCKITNKNIGIYCVEGTSGTLIQDCTLDGTGRNNLNSCGVMLGGTEITIERCNMFRMENSTSCFGHPYPTNIIVRDCFVHHLRATPGHPHYDCQQWDGGQQNIEITHNTFHNENYDTSCLMIDNYGGGSDNFLIQDNVLCGAGYTIYVDDRFYPYPITNVKFYRNKIIPGIYTYFFISSNINVPVQLGNQYLGHGGIFDAPPPGGFTEGQSVPESFYPYAVEGGGSILNEYIEPETGGITLGLGFQIGTQAGQIIGVNLRRPGEGTTLQVSIGLWRFTGSSIDGGVELLASQDFPNVVKRGLIHLAFETPIDVEVGDNLVVGAYQPRGEDGRIHFFSQSAMYWPNTRPSQYGRMTAYSNHATPVPLNGFSGHNGLYHYGLGMAVPLDSNSNDADFGVDPIFVAPWVEPAEVGTDVTVNVTGVSVGATAGNVSVGAIIHSGWPDSTNTGYLHAPGYPGSLTNWTGGAGPGVFTANTTYSFYRFPTTGDVVVDVPNVTFIGCEFLQEWQEGWSIKVIVDVPLAATFKFCTIRPALSTSIPNPAWPSAGAGLDVDGSTGGGFEPYQIPYNKSYQYGIIQDTGGILVEDCDIWGYGNSITFFGRDYQNTVRRTWVHDASAEGFGATMYHTDGPGHLNWDGCDNVLIEDCTIASLGNTNAIAFQGGVYNNIIVRRNFISGFSTCIDMGHNTTGNTNLVFQDNVIATDIAWRYGPLYTDFTANFSQPSNLWRGNKLRVLPGTVPRPGSIFSFTSADDGKFLWPNGTKSTTDFE